MNKVLALVTTDENAQKLDMIVVSWVHTTANQRYIEISATNQTLGQLLVRITSTGGGGYQGKVSGFHHKLLSGPGRVDTQITAYHGTSNLSPDRPHIELLTKLAVLTNNS